MAIIEYTLHILYTSMKNLYYGKYPLLLLRRPVFGKSHLNILIKHSLYSIKESTLNLSIKVSIFLKYGNWKVPKKNGILWLMRTFDEEIQKHPLKIFNLILKSLDYFEFKM